MPPKRPNICVAYESSSSDSTSSSDLDTAGSDHDIAKNKLMKKRPCLAGSKAGTNQSSLAVPHILDFTEQLKSGAFSDCEVRCAGHVWRLNKLILCPRSKSATPPGSIRTVFVDFLLSTGLRSFKIVLNNLETSGPQLLVNILLAKA